MSIIIVPDQKIECRIPWGSILGSLFFNILAVDTFYQCDDWHYADKNKTYVDKTNSCTSKILTKLIVRYTSSTSSTKENLLEHLRVTDLRLFHATVLFLQSLKTSENLRFLKGIERDKYLKWFNLDLHVFLQKSEEKDEYCSSACAQLAYALVEKYTYSDFLWSVFSPHAGKCGPEILWIRTILTQWWSWNFLLHYISVICPLIEMLHSRFLNFEDSVF